MLRQLLEMNSVFSAVTNPVPETAPPVRILAFRSKADFQPFQHGAANHGLYQPGTECDYIVLLDAGEETLRAGRHELVHRSMNYSQSMLPGWLEEGFADYFSTLQRKGDKAVVGRPIQNHIDLLASSEWLPAARLLEWRHDQAKNMTDGVAAQVYAQSWALTHLLMQPPDARVKLERFSELLKSGVAQAAAFEQAFGRTMDQALAEARQAVAAKRFPTREVPVGVVPQPGSFQVKTVPDVEARLVRADALLAHGKKAEAAKMINETAKRYPDHPAAAAGLGQLAMANTDYAAARTQFERALALGDKQASTYYELAMLTRDTHGSEETVLERLRQAVQANPSLADAWYLLGSALLRQGKAAEAAEALRHAVDVLPRNSMYWEGLGRAWQAAGQREPARMAAQRAMQTATTPEQSAMAQGLGREIEQNVRPKPAGKPGVVTPKTWEPRQADATVTGKLVLVDCATATLKFHIQTAAATAKSKAQVTILVSDKPNQIMLRGNSGQKREFVCGPQRIAPLVEAGYAAAPAAAEPPAPPPAAPAKPGKQGRPAPKAKPAPAVQAPAGELISLDFK
ncbi:tetratricopeptide repeat protein [Paludibaculum fermentans]|uniref:Tetratricopeptide repeat protein n=1 Tax=Paludibaculum fermentans TaxID=1473598 RepID=A0A7S7NRY5_PALFE|nr:tetratricopeptide repeat protein [Paludibaculum fermentans]QOY88663.1 tetratricopeptide repeat protein [Paludibaculum fermentans]